MTLRRVADTVPIPPGDGSVAIDLQPGNTTEGKGAPWGRGLNDVASALEMSAVYFG